MRLPFFVQFSIEGKTEKVLPASVNVRMAAGQLNVAVLDMRGTRFDDIDIAAGTAVLLEWGHSAAVRRSFPGYVAWPHQSHVVPAGGSSAMLLTMDSTLQSTRNASWRVCADYTLKATLRAVARDHAVIPQFAATDDSLWEFVQDGCSDWEFLRRVADASGLALLDRFGAVMLADPRGVVAAASSRTPVYRSNGGEGQLSIRSFDVDSGGLTPAASRKSRRALGVEPDSLRMIDVRQEPPQGPLARTAPEFQLSSSMGKNVAVVDTVDALQASQALGCLWSASAHLVGLGDPRVIPGSLVNIQGVHPNHAGLWWVEEATHKLHRGGSSVYTVEAVLKRDGTGPPPTQSFAVPAFKDPSVVLRSGSWRAVAR